MGTVVSLITRHVKKPFRDFNIESRAHAAISKEKRAAAPRHKADEINYQRLVKDYPDTYEESLKKNEKLDQYLKDVYVKSHNTVVEVDVKGRNNPERPLPVDRSIIEVIEVFGHVPKHVPLGKTTLRNAFQFIGENQVDPKLNNSTKIAEEYLLPEETVRNILKHFKLYEVYTPQVRNVKASFAGPSVKKKIQVEKPKLLQSNESKEKEMFK